MTTNITPLDSLKESAARGHQALGKSLEILSNPDNLSLPGAIDAITQMLGDLHEVLCVESINRHANWSIPESQLYSDGRPVRTVIELEPGIPFIRVWSADVDSPRDQPQVLVDMRTPSDTRWRVVILRPGEIDAVQVADNDE